MVSFPSPSSAFLASYTALFVNRRDVFLTAASGGCWHHCRRELSDVILAAALAGRTLLGLYSVAADQRCRWICLDVDDDARAGALGRAVQLLDGPACTLLELSRRGMHLWIFIEPTSWNRAHAWGRDLATRAGVPDIEVFPKGDSLNGVKAPLTRHPKSGLIYPLIDPESGEIVDEPCALISSRVPIAIPDVLPPQRERRLHAKIVNGSHNELVKEIERYTKLRFYGNDRAIGRCPFHDDRHPSLGIVGGFWKCFAGCGSGGLAAFCRGVRERGC